MLTLTLKHPPAVPLEAERLSPDVIAPLSLADICSLPVFLGKRQLRLDDLFTVEGFPGDDIELHGDLSRVKWIGRGMSRGTLRVRGSVGMHLGAYMKGGSIEVDGDAGDWLGAEMRDGRIRVRSNVGGQMAAAYRGSPSGMSGGTIIVDGTAGDEVGMRMKRGTIVVRGLAADFAGLQMKGGTIVLLSGAAQRTGAWMTRGTILSLRPVDLLPTFGYGSEIVPTFVRLYAKHLRRYGVDLPVTDGTYQRYAGDSIGLGEGRNLRLEGVPVILASAWVAMVAWFLGVMGLLLRPAGSVIPFRVRVLWAVGCGLLMLHVAVAFHLAHAWSHATAFEHTRQIGGFGEGVYVNYFFVALWMCDAIWLLGWPESYRRRPRGVTFAIHGFMAFIVFNAMVVFGTWVGRGLFAVFVVVWAARRRFTP